MGIGALSVYSVDDAGAQDQKEKKGQREGGRRRGGQRGGPGGFGGGFGGGGGGAFLLRNEAVQKELKISDIQKEKILKIQEDSQKETRELFSGLRDLDRDARQKKMEELREKAQKLGADTTKKINEVLDADQQKRLKGISLQMAGTRALLNADTAKELNITDDQKTKIQAAITAQGEKTRALFGELRGGNFDRDKFREKSEAIRAETDKAIAEVLTKDQTTKLEELKGEKFDTSSLRRGPGQRGQGGPRRGGQGGGRRRGNT